MTWKSSAVVLAWLLAAAAAGPSAARGQSSGRAEQPPACRGLPAINQAAQSGHYLFIFFWKDNDEQAQKMYAVFQKAMGDLAGSADSVPIQIAAPAERPVVDRFGVSRAPMPLVIALAPNGAVTKGFPVRFTEQELRGAFVSPCTARCMKVLQERKLVLLCVSNRQTPGAQAAWQGAQAFKADSRYAAAAEVIALDPADPGESGFLETLQVDPRTPQAVTVLLAPPGQPIAKFTGAVSKDQIVAKLASAQSSCCPGGKCGPGGCGPKN